MRAKEQKKIWSDIDALLAQAGDQALKPKGLKSFLECLARSPNRPDVYSWMPYVWHPSGLPDSSEIELADRQRAERLICMAGLDVFHKRAVASLYEQEPTLDISTADCLNGYRRAIDVLSALGEPTDQDSPLSLHSPQVKVAA